MPLSLVTDAEGIARCGWCGDDPLYMAYHDDEWGRPVSDDNRLFEKLCLEGFQAGLSWLTILRKRDNFRRAFRDFDFRKVARFNSRSVDRLLEDAGIVRHRGKIESTINNARRAVEAVEQYGSLSAMVWAWRPEPAAVQLPLPGQTEQSVALSRHFKSLGWSFLGPTTVYAFMQAMGMVNDHLPGCWVRAQVEQQQRAFQPPG